jgi:hypothetical protein
MSLLLTTAADSPVQESKVDSQTVSVLTDWNECLDKYRTDSGTQLGPLEQLLARPVSEELPVALLTLHQSAKYIQPDKLVTWFVAEVGKVLADPLLSIPQTVILVDSLKWILEREQRRDVLKPILDSIGCDRVAEMICDNPIVIKNIVCCGYFERGMGSLWSRQSAELLIAAFMDGYREHLEAICEWDDEGEYSVEFDDALEQWAAEPEVVLLVDAAKSDDDGMLLEATAEPHFQAMNAWDKQGYHEKIYTEYTETDLLTDIRLGSKYSNYTVSFTADSSYAIGKALVVCMFKDTAKSVAKLLQLLKKRASNMNASGRELQILFLQTAFFTAASVNSFNLVSTVLREAGELMYITADLMHAATRYAAYGACEQMAYALSHVGGGKEDIYWGAIRSNWKLRSRKYQLPGSQELWNSEKVMLDDLNGGIETAASPEIAANLARELNRLLRTSLKQGKGKLFKMLVIVDHEWHATIRRSVELVAKHSNYGHLLETTVLSKSVKLFDRLCEIIKPDTRTVRRWIVPFIRRKTLPILETFCVNLLQPLTLLMETIRAARKSVIHNYLPVATWLLDRKLPGGQPAIGVQDIAKCIILLLGDGDGLRDVPIIHFPDGENCLDVRRTIEMCRTTEISQYPHLCSCDNIYGSTCHISELLVLLLGRLGLSKETLPVLMKTSYVPLKRAILEIHGSSIKAHTADYLACNIHALFFEDRRPCPNLFASLLGTTALPIYSLIAGQLSRNLCLTTVTRNYMLAIGCTEQLQELDEIDDESKQAIYALSRRLGNDVAKHPALELMAAAELTMREFTCNDTAGIMMSYL